jgi:hypothetical protein
MAYEDREGSGCLFKTKEKKSEKSPDFDGYIVIDGNRVRIAAWKKEGKKGNFLSLAVRPEQAVGNARKPKAKKETDGIFDQ